MHQRVLRLLQRLPQRRDLRRQPLLLNNFRTHSYPKEKSFHPQMSHKNQVLESGRHIKVQQYKMKNK